MKRKKSPQQNAVTDGASETPSTEKIKEGSFSYEHEDPEKTPYTREARYAGRDHDKKLPEG